MANPLDSAISAFTQPLTIASRGCVTCGNYETADASSGHCAMASRAGHQNLTACLRGYQGAQ